MSALWRAGPDLSTEYTVDKDVPAAMIWHFQREA